jgi:hypothetical protein
MLGAIGWIASDGIEFTRRMARMQPGCPGYLGPARQARRLQRRPAQPGIGKTDTRRNNLCPRRPPHSREMYGGQISYDLRRLRDCQIIEHIPHSRNYQLTADGLSTALSFTRPTRRVIIPRLAEITGAGPPPGSPLRQADRACKAAIADLASHASPGIQPRPVTKHRSPHAPVVTRNPS